MEEAPLQRIPRTPEGAWYNGYAGLRAPNGYDYYGFGHSAPAPHLKDERDVAVNYYGAGGGGVGARDNDHPPLHSDLPPPHKAGPDSDAMAKYYDGGHRYPPRDDVAARGDVRPVPQDFKLYDPYSRDNNSRMEITKASEPRDFGKAYEPYPHNGPAVHYGSSFPQKDSGYGGADGYGDPPGGGVKVSYDSPRQGPAERDWELPGRLSPRRATHYEPSFQDPQASPRNNALPPWERERWQNRSPLMMVGPGGDGYEQTKRQEMFDPRAGKMAASTNNNAMTYSKQAGSVFLFIRYDRKSSEKVWQACQLAVIKDLRGEWLGTADQVYDFGDHPGRNSSGYAVFQFPSLEKAVIFYNRDKHFRTNDPSGPFGDIEIFVIELLTDPIATASYKTFLLSEVTLNDGPAGMDTYQRRFKGPFTQTLHRLGALPYAACCDRDNRKMLKTRQYRKNDLITLHLFRSLDHYKQVWGDREYSELRGVHDALATERCSLFMLTSAHC